MKKHVSREDKGPGVIQGRIGDEYMYMYNYVYIYLPIYTGFDNEPLYGFQDPYYPNQYNGM